MPVPLRTAVSSRPAPPADRRDGGRRRPVAAPSQPAEPADAAFLDYFRSPAEFAVVDESHDVRGGELSPDEGFFTFEGTICYGRRRGGRPAPNLTGVLPEVAGDIGPDGSLPFDLSEVVRNLRQERYTRRATADHGSAPDSAAGRVYYFLRPFLPVPIRKHLQKFYLRGWEGIPFPSWPVDVSVEALMQSAMGLVLRSGRAARVPFIWFWPDGAPSGGIMTHDVEGARGTAFCPELMDLDDSFGIKSAFQIVPEALHQTDTALLQAIRARGFEVNLHDLNHDGRLFQNKTLFLERAVRINRYAREFECLGFRSGAMYREQDWFPAFDFDFDMSVPNVAHLEPQRGGCCTVMPYFVGRLLELPLTTVQDYSLLHILGDYSTALWRQQIELIRARHGLISIIAHPDYIRESRARAVYVDLLGYLRDLAVRKQIWMALPTAVNHWWRNRQQMSMVPHHGSWRIVGPGSDRARVAYATLDADRVVYSLGEPS